MLLGNARDMSNLAYIKKTFFRVCPIAGS